MQSLFQGSDESPDDVGLSIIPGRVTRFVSTAEARTRVPQIGWNGVTIVKSCPATDFLTPVDSVYFVHSFCAMPNSANLDWALGVTDYSGQRYISIVQKGNILATQFHPEKSGTVGLSLLKSFLDRSGSLDSIPNQVKIKMGPTSLEELHSYDTYPKTQLVKRVVACLDVRSNDQGDLIVTKGDQYDVRENGDEEGR
jgi:glutamine amidotransferase/cyclase